MTLYCLPSLFMIAQVWSNIFSTIIENQLKKGKQCFGFRNNIYINMCVYITVIFRVVFIFLKIRMYVVQEVFASYLVIVKSNILSYTFNVLYSQFYEGFIFNFSYWPCSLSTVRNTEFFKINFIMWFLILLDLCRINQAKMISHLWVWITHPLIEHFFITVILYSILSYFGIYNFNPIVLYRKQIIIFAEEQMCFMYI